MPSFNQVILVGHLTRDPDLRHVGSGKTACCNVGLAVNKTWYDKSTQQKKERVTFIDITCWGRTAEVTAEYLSKGSPAMFIGELELDQWEDKNTGEKRSKLKVRASQLQMLGSGSGGGGGGQRQSTAETEQTSGWPQPQSDAPSDPATDQFYDSMSSSVPDDEVPF